MGERGGAAVARGGPRAASLRGLDECWLPRRWPAHRPRGSSPPVRAQAFAWHRERRPCDPRQWQLLRQLIASGLAIELILGFIGGLGLGEDLARYLLEVTVGFRA